MKRSLKADARDLYSREGSGALTVDLYRQCTLLSFSSPDPRCWLHRDVFREDKDKAKSTTDCDVCPHPLALCGSRIFT